MHIGFPFNHVAVAGTFDGIHDGHRKYLALAFHLAKRVTIFLTDDIYTVSKNHTVRSLADREKDLCSYLASIPGTQDRYIIRYVSSKLICATEIIKSDIDSVLCDPTRLPWVEIIQEGRRQNRRPGLVTIVKPRHVDKNGDDISSSQIVGKKGGTRQGSCPNISLN